MKGVATGSTTNLWGGLEGGATYVRTSVERVMVVAQQGHLEEAAPSVAVQRVFLFSDGMVNAGETNKERILQKVKSARSNRGTAADDERRPTPAARRVVVRLVELVVFLFFRLFIFGNAAKLCVG